MSQTFPTRHILLTTGSPPPPAKKIKGIIVKLQGSVYVFSLVTAAKEHCEILFNMLREEKQPLPVGCSGTLEC